MLWDHDFLVLTAKLAAALHLLGALSALQAVRRARTPQGAIAWAIGLVSFPYGTLPLYWIFGRDRFNGYTLQRRVQDHKILPLRQLEASRDVAPHSAVDGAEAYASVLEELAKLPFTQGNDARLCIDGAQTFDAIFAAIDGANRYLLVQFFIVHDDDIGREFHARLVAAAQRGVRVYFLYDEVGSHALPKSYRKSLQAAGVDVLPFKTTKGAKNRFQLNFRNHRKIVIADGLVALVGGHNVGDEYLGKNPKFGRWRDTHVRVEGPAVGQVQVSFVEDWHWSSGAIPQLPWEFPRAAVPGKTALVLPSGPADQLDSCCLFFLQAINAARHRVWITSPYFVPDPQIMSALQLAAMRGVDVRILLPAMADHIFVYLASFSFLKDTLPHGVKLFRYQGGFLHQKVLLVDDRLASVGTANFDNRSFRLNFEITILFADRDFSREVEKMLREDFAQAIAVKQSDLDDRSPSFRLAVQFSRLLSPIL